MEELSWILEMSEDGLKDLTKWSVWHEDLYLDDIMELRDIFTRLRIKLLKETNALPKV